MKMRLIAVMMVLLSVASMCMAEEKVITAAADPYPPFVDQSDPQEGLSLAIIRAAYKTQGYTVKMDFIPWVRAKTQVVEGKIDILPDVWMNDENLKIMQFSEPYAVNTIKFIKNVDDPFDYTGLESLKGKKIGTIRGYVYNEDFAEPKDFTRDDVVDFITNVKKLLVKRIDLTLEDEIVAKAQIAKTDPSMLTKITFVEKPLDSKNLYLTTGLANPRHQEIVDAFNKGLTEIKASGEFAKIMESYGITDTAK
ncbi:substrate-binding periplasmic protein [Desulfopila aestuarii]|uniref:Amino acid ABC transporter substrate-binding protein, PAAT family n=1 Tax=Desulfopila aestuarii DSM 18488 TaxID=1121416 RepID=A0A1M7XWQ9_9BACT|nr:transporter substrate-binding domain-containing protein [Desulfopila aestuarii]SHO43223.1 amino acid ABC transporter substrate-binding protein, PAAT family [Desulfopila aestuarii DSM 18488]